MKVDDKSPKRPLIFYYLIAMVVLMLLNALVFPAMLATPVTETFLCSTMYSRICSARSSVSTREVVGMMVPLWFEARVCLQTSYRSQISEAARHTKAAKTSTSLS